MISPWDFMQPSLDGVFGRKTKRVVSATLTAFVILGGIWHPALYWFIRQLADWQLSIWKPLLQNIYLHISHTKVPTSVPSLR
jgi:hypothetical protein